MKLKIFAFSVGIVFFTLITSHVVYAQTTKHVLTPPAENISSFDSQVKVNSDGTIAVTETIDYDFGNLQKHGIYRYISYVKQNSDGKKYKLTIDVTSITDSYGRPYKYTTEQSGGQITLKVGDPNATITGLHTYVINYTVSGAITYFSDHDELYWNTTGNGWTVPILYATSEVVLPKSVSSQNTNTTCYTGVVGSKAKDCTSSYAFGTYDYSATDLSVGEGLSTVAGFPKGLVAVIEPVPSNDLTGVAFTIVQTIIFSIGSIIWYLLIPGFVLFRIISEKMNIKKKQKIVAAWFQPPNDAKGVPLNPAEVGALIDSTMDNRDVVALIIWLAQKGYLKITQKGTDDISLTKIKDLEIGESIGDKEVKLFAGIFGSDTVSMNSLKKPTAFSDSIVTYKKEVLKDLKTRGFYKENPSTVDTFFTTLSVLSLYFGLNIPLTILSIFWGRKSARRTDLGIEKYSEAVSLKNFLASQTEQLDFQAQNQMFFEKLLPYATAFGCEKIWVGKFKDISTYKADWYDGENLLLITAFTHSMGDTVQAATATRSSSGFGSGFSGGFSGGGGGGGGGGSW